MSYSLRNATNTHYQSLDTYVQTLKQTIAIYCLYLTINNNNLTWEGASIRRYSASFLYLQLCECGAVELEAAEQHIHWQAVAVAQRTTRAVPQAQAAKQAGRHKCCCTEWSGGEWILQFMTWNYTLKYGNTM